MIPCCYDGLYYEMVMAYVMRILVKNLQSLLGF